MDEEPKQEPPPRRRGRRSGDSGTRLAVLNAARARFAADGFAATTIRKVAADAGVDAALVMQFFRSKEELFAATLSIAPELLVRITAAFDGPRASLGERVARTFLELWEGPPAESEPLLAMIRSAVTGDPLSAQLRDYIQVRLSETISPKLGSDPEAVASTAVASAMLVGLILARVILKVPALANLPRESVIRLAAPAIQVLMSNTKED